VIVRHLGVSEYAHTYEKMRNFTDARQAETPDELWLCEHPPVFTQGLAGKAEHVLAPGDIEVVASNRGGQVTYHGPGQVVAYPLLDLRRRGYFVKELVFRIEEAVIRTLRHFDVTGHRVAGAPGIYVRMDDPSGHTPLAISERKLGSDPNFLGLGKIAALGIKVSRHCSYHGVALNVAMDLNPFKRINPCGYVGLQTIDLASLGFRVNSDEASQVLADKLQASLG
jgi:lipoyl(octanoyl) transferase